MALPSGLQATVASELGHVKELIRKILDGEERNNLVCSNDWLTPTVEMGKIPYDHPRGELCYYTEIQKALEIAQKVGAIPAHYMDYVIRAPMPIRDLLERSDDRVA